jgi:adenylate kinase
VHIEERRPINVDARGNQAAGDSRGRVPTPLEATISVARPSPIVIDLTETGTERPPRVLLVGPPGAGKSTQGKRLAVELGVPHVSTGDLLRAEVRRNSPVGREAIKYMRAGELLPDWLLLFALERPLSRAFEVGAIFDGYPRTVEQAKRFMRSLGIGSLDRVIELAASDETVVARLAKRTPSPPGGAVDERDDDDEHTVRIRLAVYRAQTQPMLDFFRAAGLLVTIDGTRPPDEVAAELKRLLGSRA